jgi:hypothetical protein
LASTIIQSVAQPEMPKNQLAVPLLVPSSPHAGYSEAFQRGLELLAALKTESTKYDNVLEAVQKKQHQTSNTIEKGE